MQGMMWMQLLPHLLESARYLIHPHFIAVHPGGGGGGGEVDYLPQLSTVDLINAMVEDFCQDL